MGDKEEFFLHGDHKNRDSIVKRSSQPSLLDSGEDFEMLDNADEDSSGDDLPPLEDAGGGESKEEHHSREPARTKDTTLEVSTTQDEWQDVLGNGHLKKKVLEPGQGPDSRPLRGQIVQINVKSFLSDGIMVEEQLGLSFTLGDGDVIQALDLVVQLMEIGEKALVETSAKYAFGVIGSETLRVPPDADLTLHVQLLSTGASPDFELMNPTEKVTLAGVKRERGNMYYQRGDYTFAVNSYSIALQIAETSSKVDISFEEEAELLEMKVKCLNNMAAAQLKLEHYEAALRSCVSVLTHQPDNVKALFRKGKVLALQGEYAESIQTLKRALKLEPSNKTIHTELSKLVKKHSEQKGMEQAMYKKMLGNPPDAILQPQRFKSWGLNWKWLFGATAMAIGGVALSVFIAARN
ncbi:peptidyl-prolyl cis-trans isomerase FKBP8-like isoform X1 [Denticeps clupeoides]|uniref:peptidylprolyl isomerase n=1 Tax=Denticeps clupeoides TaxID=299321 RepID=A0A8C4FNT3_9TELE|nr:peptidyl-prolyl cis-trans isomerase FKBP8-like isoform X1 [Denticeps clupeoides]XP_028821063.1 peptidyl-prolyl cis-trans isomerase FKBP8-like isoform X1 [Denticeps clupeoides]